MYAVLSTAITVNQLPISVAQVKLQQRLASNFEDSLLQGYIYAAVDEAEGLTKRRLTRQVWHLYPDSRLIPVWVPLWHVFPGDRTQPFSLADFSPVVSVEGPYDSENVTVPGFVMTLNRTEPESLTLSPGLFDEGQYLKVTCGYASPAAVPPTIIQWLLMRVGSFCESREADNETPVVEVPFAKSLLMRNKIWRF